jgi:Domain of unknown function (DUF5069)
MKTQAFFIDLTERPPRSFRVRLGGFVILARMIDKGRATLSKKNGEYIYNSPTDQHLVRFLGFDTEALLNELAAGKGDGEILQWVSANAKTPRAPWEIESWSASWKNADRTATRKRLHSLPSTWANIPKPVKTLKPGSKPLSSMTMPALAESRKSRAAA